MNIKNLNDENFLSSIDTEEKAYLLGWIASNSSISDTKIKIFSNEKDNFILKQFLSFISPNTQIKNHNTTITTFSICSKIMVKNVLEHLQIKSEGNLDTVRFPNLQTDELKWHFLRGFFENNGNINQPDEKNTYPKCDIMSDSLYMRQTIKEFCKIPCFENNNHLYWSHNNALDFLGKIYENARYYLTRKKDLYINWSQWISSLCNKNSCENNGFLKWSKTRKDAVAPSKEKASDSGYDLVLLEKVKQFGNIEMFDTGIKVSPPFGWYFDLVPRSSIIKSGYMMANSFGVIDRGYTGNILVPLIKIDPLAPDLELPKKIVQLIPRPIINLQVIEVASLENTLRSDGGFGSSDK